MIISMERGRKGKENKTLRSAMPWCEETGNKLNQASDSSSEVSSVPFRKKLLVPQKQKKKLACMCDV